jgi:AcrR family transcriptional regulator
MKTDKSKQLLIEQLRKTPIILVACEKMGVSRATFYRWYKEDEKFKELAQEALGDGKNLINDMAESQLISSIKDKNFQAIAYWLKHNHPNYSNRLELSGKISTQNEKLTPEQEEIVKIALQNAGLIKEEDHDIS